MDCWHCYNRSFGRDFLVQILLRIWRRSKSREFELLREKGVVFKTYEGRVVQEGFQSPTAGGLQSNEFRFSVVDSEIAEQLERASGKFVELRYKEYNGMLPWRGTSNFVVTEVLTVNNSGKTDGSALPFDQ